MADVLDDAAAQAAPAPTPISTAGLAVVGYVEERSVHTVSGWLWLPDEPQAHPGFEVLLPMADGNTQVLARGIATLPTAHLQSLGVGNGLNGFSVVLPRLLTPEERDRVEVRAERGAWSLPMSPWLKTEYQPIGYIAMDIVNNCNIRCPFCVYDYKDTKNTKFMTDDTFETVLRIMPYTADGCFWLSCLHEPTMHPKLLEFIQRVPLDQRRKLMFTSNIAKRMPQSFFDGLARSGMDHINISFESAQPDVYMKLRKGAKYEIFRENRAKLVAAFDAARAEGIKTPKLNYNMMAYRSNAEELPELAARLAEEPSTTTVQIRDTLPVPHIPGEFKDEEFLDRPGWELLYQRLKPLLKGKVTLFLTPAYLEGKEDAAVLEDVEPAAPAPKTTAKLPPGIHQTVNLRIEWDGTLEVQGNDIHFQDPAWHLRLVKTRIQFLRDPLQFLTAL
jgi:molybdenum cofactor biosynthesis enzyme MoaA